MALAQVVCACRTSVSETVMPKDIGDEGGNLGASTFLNGLSQYTYIYTQYRHIYIYVYSIHFLGSSFASRKLSVFPEHRTLHLVWGQLLPVSAQ